MPAMFKACGWWIKKLDGTYLKREGMIVKCALPRGHKGECEPPALDDTLTSGIKPWLPK